MDSRSLSSASRSMCLDAARALALLFGLATSIGAHAGSLVVGVAVQTPPANASAVDTRPAPAPTSAGSASITGRVTDAETGQGLARARVIAYAFDATNSSHPFGTETDMAGRYLLSGLPAGRYLVTVTRGGYLQRQYGQSSPRGIGQRLSVADGAKVSGADVALVRGAVVTGVVTDNLGEPAPGIPVKLLASHGSPGRPRYLLFQQRPTDDRGQFRLHDVAPGEYLLMADPTTAMQGVRLGLRQPDDPADLMRTYAPGVPDVSAAGRLDVTAGHELNVDIELLTGRLATVAGRVVDSKGQPVQRTSVILVPDAAGLVADRLTAPVHPSGDFVLQGVSPGTYTLHVSTPMPLGSVSSPDELVDAERATLPIVVEDTGLDGLIVTTSPPTTITGRLVVEGDAEALRGHPLLVSGWARDAAHMPGVLGRGSVRPDLTIRVSGLVGHQMLRLSGLPRGWWVKDVRINGQDAFAGYDFGNSQRLAGLEIVVSDRAVGLAGHVLTARGEAAADALVLIIPDDLDTFEGFMVPGHGATVHADRHGAFVADGIRPGTYHVAAIDVAHMDYRLFDDSDRLRALSLRAQRVAVSEGSVVQVVIQLRDP